MHNSFYFVLWLSDIDNIHYHIITNIRRIYYSILLVARAFQQIPSMILLSLSLSLSAMKRKKTTTTHFMHIDRNA